MAGPLAGIRIIEMGGIGPSPFCGMLLADQGAEVIRVDRPGTTFGKRDLMMRRSRKLVHLDLKSPDGIQTLRELVTTADALLEGFRPGAMERLGIGPDVLCADNPQLVYARMTGWGQDGSYAPYAGHDINYVALTGALHAIGPAERPVPPLAFLGDLGGGGMFLGFSVTSALLHARSTGKGQVIDCAMADGVGLLATPFYGRYDCGEWVNEREANLLDGGAHFYNVYKTSDNKFVSIGPLESAFYTQLLDKLGLQDDPQFLAQMEQDNWPVLRERMATIFDTKTQSEWCAILEYTDCCFAPVLTFADAPSHPHAMERGSFVELDGVVQPSPAPRYSGTPLDPPFSSVLVDPAEILREGRR